MDLNAAAAVPVPGSAAAPVPVIRPRILSIDTLRGLTVAFMILVNNAGDGKASFAQLRHSVWNGCTLTDLVFPTFLFVMGISAAISFQSRVAKGIGRGEIALQVLRRSLLIILIGLILNALPIPHLSTLRFFGVMQRIGLCYFFAGIALLYLRPKGVAILTILCLAGYWALMTQIPVPGFGYPGIEVPVLAPVGNLASYIDRLIIPQAHRYHFSFYDPEGILSTIPAIATTCIGILTGIWSTRRDVSDSRKQIGLAVAATLLIAGGLIWSSTFPLNKRLWTSSYVLYAAGIGLALFVLLRWLVDRKRVLKKSLEPVLAFGMNALTAYVFSEVLAVVLDSIRLPAYGTVHAFLYQFIPAPFGSAGYRSLIWSILFVVVCWIPVFYLRRRGVVVKL